MKTITITKLTLHNFQNGNFVLEPNSEDINIFGENGAGKTRILSAFSWLLFGKDSLGRSDFSIKNLDADGNAESGLEHTVEGILLVDGNPITLKRVYHEVWTKKRGTAQSTLTGNTTDYYINGVPAKENEYKAYIADLFGDEEKVKLLTSPTAFPALPWQKQRSLLLEVCGDISDAQVIATDERLSPLTDLLKKYTVSKTPLDDLRKVVMGRKTEINKKIDQLPIRIDEVFRGLPDITGLNLKEIETTVGTLEASVNECKLKLQGVDNGSTIAELSKKLAIINAEISKLEQNHYNNTMKFVVNLTQQINEIKSNKQNEDLQISNIKAVIKMRQEDINTIEAKLTTLREKWTAVDAGIFQDTIEQICPTCKQSLPVERVQEAREKALADFNRKKAERLFEIETEGKRLASNKGTYADEIEKLHQSLQNRPDINADNLEVLIAQRDTTKIMAEDYASIPERIELIERKKEIEIGIEASKEALTPRKDAIQEEITNLEGLLQLAKEKADRFQKRESGEKRVQELKAEEKKLAKEFEELERQLFLCESFIKAKVSMLTERINSKFEMVRFILFETQINGGLSETCQISVNGVGYNSGLNSAARTNAGLDIIKTLQKHFGLQVCVFVDNAESVVNLCPLECQVIRLVVSEKDTVLRIETTAKKEQRIAA